MDVNVKRKQGDRYDTIRNIVFCLNIKYLLDLGKFSVSDLQQRAQAHAGALCHLLPTDIRLKNHRFYHKKGQNKLRS